jgi:hypothetical protein
MTAAVSSMPGGLGHRAFEAEPGDGFGECALVAGCAVVGGVDR